MPYKEHLRKSQLPMFIVLPDCIDTLLIWTTMNTCIIIILEWYTIVGHFVMLLSS